MGERASCDRAAGACSRCLPAPRSWQARPGTGTGTGTARPRGWPRLQDQPPLHEPDRQPPGDEREDHEEREVPHVGPALEAEHGMSHELDAVVQRVEVCEHLSPVRELVDREERPGHEDIGVSRPLCQYEKLSIDFERAAMKIPN